MHWSVEECAYRVTIEANNYTSPEIWLTWERCTDEQAVNNGLLTALNSIARLFAADPVWLESGAKDEPLGCSGDIIPFPDQPHNPPN